MDRGVLGIGWVEATIALSRPVQPWSPTPANVLPTAVLARLVHANWRYTVVLDGRPVGTIGKGEMREFTVAAGEHRVRLRFVGLRRSAEVVMTLAEGEVRGLRCGTSGLGWPTLHEAPPGR